MCEFSAPKVGPKGVAVPDAVLEVVLRVLPVVPMPAKASPESKPRKAGHVQRLVRVLGAEGWAAGATVPDAETEVVRKQKLR